MRLGAFVILLALLIGGGVYLGLSRRTSPDVPSYSGISVSSVIVKELAPGLDGSSAFGPGRKASVHYKAWVYDPAKPANQGPLIGESAEGTPLVVEWGKGVVPAGFEQGMAGMRERCKRELVVPAELSLGKVDGKKVPEGAMLLIEAYVEKVTE